MEGISAQKQGNNFDKAVVVLAGVFVIYFPLLHLSTLFTLSLN